MRWSEIKGTTYILSDSGIVRNTKTGKVLKPKARKYLTVTLCVDGIAKDVAIHRLVAEYYVPNPNNLPVVRHKDGDTSNYDYTNLCWGTYSDNMEDAIRNNENPGVRGRVVLQYKNGGVVARYRSLASTARAIGLAKPNNGGASHIKRACESNEVKTLFGFTFAYEKEGDSYQME